MKETTGPPTPLFTAPFVALNVSAFLTYCNIAILFQFYTYLLDLGISAQQAGLLIGLFSFMVLLLRPFVSPVINTHNFRPWLIAGTIGTAACLAAYYLATGYWTILILRLAHGALYVLLANANMAALVGAIPPGRSGQAFGVIGVTTMLPMALIPPFLPVLTAWLGGYREVLAASALPMLAVLALLPFLKPVDSGDPDMGKAVRWSELGQVLRDRSIVQVLLVNLFIYTAFAAAFYYIKSYAGVLGIAGAGLFFTLSSGAEIAVRTLGGLLDRLSKKAVLAGALALLSLCYAALALGPGPMVFFTLAVIFGLGWGVCIPATNALIFDLSRPNHRAMNTNLGLEMLQGGYFLGPWLGGMILAGGRYEMMFLGCAVLCLTGAVLAHLIPRQSRPAA